jgi:hypothetical protein
MMLDDKFTIEIDFNEIFPCVVDILKDDREIVEMEIDMVEQMDRGLVKFVDKKKDLAHLRKVAEAFNTILDYYDEEDEEEDEEDLDAVGGFLLDKDE